MSVNSRLTHPFSHRCSVRECPFEGDTLSDDLMLACLGPVLGCAHAFFTFLAPDWAHQRKDMPPPINPAPQTNQLGFGAWRRIPPFFSSLRCSYVSPRSHCEDKKLVTHACREKG